MPDFLVKSLGETLQRRLFRRVSQNSHRLMIRRETPQRIIGDQETQCGDSKRSAARVTGILARDARLPSMRRSSRHVRFQSCQGSGEKVAE